MTIKVNWDSVPDATHFCPETDYDWPCYYKKNSSGGWLGKLDPEDCWSTDVIVDQHTLENMIAKEN